MWWGNYVVISELPEDPEKKTKLYRDCFLELIKSVPDNLIVDWMTIQVIIKENIPYWELMGDGSEFRTDENEEDKSIYWTSFGIRIKGMEEKHGDQRAECAAGNAGDAQGDAADRE